MPGPGGYLEAHPLVKDDPKEVGEVDYLVPAVKAHGLTAIAPLLAPLIGEATAVVPAQNGIPWWYFARHGGPWEGTRPWTPPGTRFRAHDMSCWK